MRGETEGVFQIRRRGGESLQDTFELPRASVDDFGAPNVGEHIAEVLREVGREDGGVFFDVTFLVVFDFLVAGNENVFSRRTNSHDETIKGVLEQVELLPFEFLDVEFLATPSVEDTVDVGEGVEEQCFDVGGLARRVGAFDKPFPLSGEVRDGFVVIVVTDEVVREGDVETFLF